jgi:hypothetical protein
MLLFLSPQSLIENCDRIQIVSYTKGQYFMPNIIVAPHAMCQTQPCNNGNHKYPNHETNHGEEYLKTLANLGFEFLRNYWFYIRDKPDMGPYFGTRQYWKPIIELAGLCTQKDQTWTATITKGIHQFGHIHFPVLPHFTVEFPGGTAHFYLSIVGRPLTVSSSYTEVKLPNENWYCPDPRDVFRANSYSYHVCSVSVKEVGPFYPQVTGTGIKVGNNRNIFFDATPA